MALWEDVQELGSSTWEQVTGGLQRWVGIEINEEIDQLNDQSIGGTSDPGTGSRTTGSPPPSDGYRGDVGGGGGVTLQTAATVAGLVASAIVVYSFVKG